jgi:hypothetical protein
VNPEAAEERLRDPSPSLPQIPPNVLHTGYLKIKKILIRKLSHTYCSSHSCSLKHSLSLVLHKSPLKIAKRKTKISPNFMMCGLSSVLILE